ncbi:winged helix-turn-helix domain-containing protein [Achromobacter denitrificans]|uniref:winged helix-turn-helix domain-containing protein n=1 Tax=Achromobacter denitrificans TaxID=32002 RepID=UPI0014680418|nr:winged helix-turn-helix domain-containing protein [Achromobacter denitrificans]CAB3821835.1 hypothetical protein LMG1860_01352 [Achromobacter denitrificans]
MHQRGSVLVLARDHAVNLAEVLGPFHWAACAFDSMAGLRDGLRGRVVDAVVLQGNGPNVPERLASLRREAPASVLIWHGRGATPEERVEALDAGADACAEAGMAPREWDALLRSLCRRGRRGASGWRVDVQTGTLAGPAGQVMPLTPTECAFFVQLLSTPGHRLRRETLLPEGVGGSRDAARRVDVLVSRLRAKAQRLDIEFPVLAVRNWGYMLRPDSG